MENEFHYIRHLTASGDWEFSNVKSVGQLSKLTTGNKEDVVSALNELNQYFSLNEESIQNLLNSVDDINEVVSSLDFAIRQEKEQLEELVLDIEAKKSELNTVIANTRTELNEKIEKSESDIENLNEKTEKLQQDIVDNGISVDGKIVSIKQDIVDTNLEVSRRLSKSEYDENVGVNKWIATLYESDKKFDQEHPKMSHTVGIEPVYVKESDDSVSLFQAVGDKTGVLHLYTNIYVRSAKNISFNIGHETSASVLNNGGYVYYKTGKGSGAISISLIEGWNNIEFLVAVVNGAKLTTSAKISAMVDKMTTIIGVGNKNDTRLKNAETMIKQTNEELSLKADSTSVESLGNVVKENTAQININSEAIESKVAKSDFNNYTGRLESAETQIKQTNKSIESLATKTDYDKLNGAIESQQSSIKQVADAIDLKASKSDLNVATGNISKLDAQLSVQAKQIESKVSQTEVDKAVNNIQLGGRNLALGSDFKLSSPSAYFLRTYNLSEDWVVGETYTATIWGNVNEGQKFGIWANGATTQVGVAVKVKDGLYRATFTVDKEPVIAGTGVNWGNKKLNLYNYPNVTTGASEVNFIKLEKGNKGTDWTSAPEDINARISNAETSIAQTSKSIELKADKTIVDNLTNEVSLAKASLEVQAGQIQSKVGQTEVNNTVSNVVNNLVVGGRNIARIGDWEDHKVILAREGYTLTLNDASPTGTNGIRIKISSLKDNLELNSEYIFSFKIRKSSGTLLGIGGHVDTSLNIAESKFISVDGVPFDGRYDKSYKSDTLNDGKWHTVICSIKTSSALVDEHYLYIQPNRSDTKVCKVQVKEIKIEKGSKFTGWSPAPEDVESAIVNSVDGIGTRNLFRKDYVSFAKNNSNGYYVADSEDTNGIKVKGWAQVVIPNQNLVKTLKPNTEYSISYKYRTDGRTSNTVAYKQDSHGSLLIHSGVSGYPSVFLDRDLDVTIADTWTKGNVVERQATFTTPANLHDTASNYKIIAYSSRRMKSDDVNVLIDCDDSTFYDIMLVEGNRIVDWLPAPEETNNRILDVNTDSMNLLQDTMFATPNNFKKDVISDKTGLYTRGVGISISKDDIERYYARNSLKVVQTGTPATGNDFAWKINAIDNTIDSLFGATGVGYYTLSFYAKASKSIGLHLRFGVAEDNNIVNIGTGWKHYTLTLKAESNYWSTIFGRLSAEGTVWLNSVKLERGKKATTWTPSFLDYDYLNTQKYDGKNLLSGTKDFSNTDDGSWNYLNNWNKEPVSKDGLTVLSRTGNWHGAYLSTYLEVGVYTFSLYAKTDTATELGWTRMYPIHDTITGLATVDISSLMTETSAEWERKHYTFEVKKAGIVSPRMEIAKADNVNKLYICGYKLERGYYPTGWSESEKDIRNSFTRLETSITQTKEAIELKATKSEVDTLSNKVSSAEASLVIQADKIESKVSKTELQTSGRNLARLTNTNVLTSWNDFTSIETIKIPNTNYYSAKAKVKTKDATFAVQQGVNGGTVLENGKTYTLSYMARANKNFILDYTFIMNSIGGNLGLSQFAETRDMTVGTSWKKIVFTFVYTGTEGATSWVMVGVRGGMNQSVEVGDWVEFKDVMLEEGTVATAWSPAPEDINDRISSMETSITQSNEAIELRAKKTEVTDAIQGIKIGGTNLWLNSDKFRVGNTSGTNSYITPSITEEGYLKVVAGANNTNYLSNFYTNANDVLNIQSEILNGEDFVVSFDIMSHDTTDMPSIYLKPKLSYTKMVGNISNKFSRVHLKGKWVSEGSIAPHLGFNGCVGTYYFRNVKFEKGNKPTEWTPSPKDVQTSIKSVETSIIQTSEQISLNASALESSVVKDNIVDYRKIRNGYIGSLTGNFNSLVDKLHYSGTENVKIPNGVNKLTLTLHESDMQVFNANYLVLTNSGVVSQYDKDGVFITSFVVKFKDWFANKSEVINLANGVKYINYTLPYLEQGAKWKLEFGSVSTPFSYSSNELVNKITDMNASLKVNADNIASRVTKTEMNTAVSTAVSNVAVGGTNLINGSGNFDTDKYFNKHWSSNGGGVIFDEKALYEGKPTIKTTVGSGIIYNGWLDVVVGKEYTYSAMIKSDKAIVHNGASPLHFWVGLNKTNQGKFVVVNKSEDYTTADIGKWKKMWTTLKFTGDANTFKPFIYRGGGNENAPIVNVAYLKFEEGNKVTTYSMSDLDTQDRLDDKVGNIELGENLITTTSGWEVGTTAIAIGKASTKAVSKIRLRYFDNRINVEPNQTYTLTSQNPNYALGIHEMDANGYLVKDSLWITDSKYKFKTTNTTSYFNLVMRKINEYDEITLEDLQWTKFSLTKGETYQGWTPAFKHISDINQKADSITMRVEKATVGGLNLALRSDDKKKGTAYRVGGYDLIEDWVKGETYTVTAWLTEPPVDRTLGIWINGSMTSVGRMEYIKPNVVRKTFTVPDIINATGENAGAKKINFYNLGTAGGTNQDYGTMTIDKIMVEKGSIGSEYSKLTPETANEVAQLKIDANSITSTVSKIQTDVNSIQVGGRNLLRESSKVNMLMNNSTVTPMTITTMKDEQEEYIRYVPTGETLRLSMYKWYHSFTTIPKFEKDKTYTISAMVRSVGGNSTVGVNIRNNVTGSIYTLPTISKVIEKDKWTRLVYSFTPNKDMPMSEQWLYNVTSSSGFPLDFKMIKLEEGSIATSWSHAPEDINNRFDNVESSIKQTADSITSTVSALRSGGRNLAIGSGLPNDTNWWWNTSSNINNNIKSYSVENGEYVTTITKGTATTTWSVLQREKMSIEKLKPNTEYVVSFDVKPSETFTATFRIATSGDTYYLTNVASQVLTANVWNRAVFRLKTVTTMPALQGQIFHMSGLPKTAGATISMKNLMFEEGNIPSAFVPAPEDISTQIQQTADSINLNVVKNNEVVSKINASTEGVKIKGDKIDITGAVTLSALNSSLKSSIESIDSRDNQYNYKYYKKIVLYGDSTSTYYPVIIKGGNQDIKREIMIKRGYAEQAPNDWNTSTHKGGLTCKIKTNFGGWGGATYSWEISELEEMYTNTFAGATFTGNMTMFAIFLRGGGTTGAVYHLYSDQPLDNNMYEVLADGTKLPAPQIAYSNTETIFYHAPTSTLIKAPVPRTYTNSVIEEIRRRKYVSLVQATDTQIGNWKYAGTTYINGGQIYTDSITANQIATGTITANEIAIGTITANEISAGAITSVKLSADAIDGKTITGATIQTSKTVTTNGGLIINSTGLKGYNSSGVLKTSLSNTGVLNATDAYLTNAYISGSVHASADSTFAGKIETGSDVVVGENLYLLREKGSNFFKQKALIFAGELNTTHTAIKSTGLGLELKAWTALKLSSAWLDIDNDQTNFSAPSWFNYDGRDTAEFGKYSYALSVPNYPAYFGKGFTANGTVDFTGATVKGVTATFA